MPDSHDPACVLKSGRGLTTHSHSHKHSLKVKRCNVLQRVIRSLGNPESLLVLLIVFLVHKQFFMQSSAKINKTECIQQVPTEVIR